MLRGLGIKRLARCHLSLNLNLNRCLSAKSQRESSFPKENTEFHSQKSSQSIQNQSRLYLNGENVKQGAKQQCSDTFGTLSTHIEKNYEDKTYRGDEKDIFDESEHAYIRLSKYNRANRQAWYGSQIEKLGKQNRIADAIDMLEVKMLKEDRVEPNEYVFTTLIGVLGRVGYTKKAFQLFNKMKQFGITPIAPTYTALFNSCANSPYKDDGLNRARHLHQVMTLADHIPNTTTSASMIKCYGITGDIGAAFKVVDDMIQHRIPIKIDTYNALLVACITDKEEGLKHSIQVWRRMAKKNHIKPTVTTYNLLLRAVRDCGLGSAQLFQQLLPSNATVLNADGCKQSVVHQNQTIQIQSPDTCKDSTIPTSNTDFKLTELATPTSGLATPTPGLATPTPKLATPTPGLDSPMPGLATTTPILATPTPGLATPSTELATATPGLATNTPGLATPRIPDILQKISHQDNQESFAVQMCSSRYQKLQLLGGVDGILSRMKRDSLKPTPATDTLLLDLLPQGRRGDALDTATATDMEEQLVRRIAGDGHQIDAGFANALIRRRAVRGDFDAAKEVFGLMTSHKVAVDMRTFGCLAIACKQKKQGLALVHDIEKSGSVPSVEFFQILLKSTGLNFSYKTAVLRKMKVCQVVPSEALIADVEMSIQRAKRLIVDGEQLCRSNHRGFIATPRWKVTFKDFIHFYNTWLKSVQMQMPSRDAWIDYKSKKNLTK